MAHASNGSVQEINEGLITVLCICPKCGKIVTRITMAKPIRYSSTSRNVTCGYCHISFPVTVTGD